MNLQDANRAINVLHSQVALHGARALLPPHALPHGLPHVLLRVLPHAHDRRGGDDSRWREGEDAYWEANCDGTACRRR